MNNRKLWIALGVVIFGSFAVLGGVGRRMISHAPPIPRAVVTAGGRTLFDGDTIRAGQGVWQSIGGQEVGSIWGHGAYVAPDWSADWLHRELVFTLDTWARETGAPGFDALDPDRQAALKSRLTREMRTNTYDEAAGRIIVSPVRAQAFTHLRDYYADVFAKGRTDYAIPAGALVDTTKQTQMAAFFWWTAWAASTNRAGQRHHVHEQLAARAFDRQ
jgi:nitric oxide reductase subunit B